MTRRVLPASVLMKVEVHESGVFDAFSEQLTSFLSQVAAASERGATVATQQSRQRYRSLLSGRPIIGPRPGRPTTQGHLESAIQWSVNASGDGASLQVGQLTAIAPYWVILELGTGNSGQMITDSETKTGPVFSVPTQVGRPISRGLVWSTKGGVYVPPTAGIRQHQLQPVGRVRGAPVRGPVRGWSSPMRIRREIEAKHFVQEGARRGFEVYQGRLYAAAAATFNYHGGRRGR